MLCDKMSTRNQEMFMQFERFLGQAVVWSLFCFSSENTV